MENKPEELSKNDDALRVDMLMNRFKMKHIPQDITTDDAAMLIGIRNRFRLVENNMIANETVKASYPEFLKFLEGRLRTLVTEFEQNQSLENKSAT